jgi:hypothetical protein
LVAILDNADYYVPITLGPHGKGDVGTLGVIVELTGPLAGHRTHA